MHAALADGQHVALVLDGPGTQQDFPVGTPGHFGKRRRQDQQVDLAERTEEFGKAQVVADRQPDAPERRLEGHRLPTGFDRRAFVVTLLALLEAEQVDLVVARHPCALRVKHQAGVQHFVFDARHQRHRAADDPDAVFARRLREKVLDRPVAIGLAYGDLVGVAPAHDRKVLGQCHKLRALRHRLGDQRAGGAQVFFDARGRDHLDRGDPRIFQVGKNGFVVRVHGTGPPGG